MKSTKSVALLIATIAIIAAASYYWYTQTGKNIKANKLSVVGEWKLDSVKNLPKNFDSSFKDTASVIFGKDKAYSVEFKTDSTFYTTSESPVGKYYLTDSSIYIKQLPDTIFIPYKFSHSGDSTFSMIMADNSDVYYKRLK